MKTLKQQFNSAASGAIVHLRGRERALEGFGWAGRQAEWIALACLHGGVFTRAQWTSFLGCHHEKVRRAVRALVAQGVAVEEDPPGIDGIGSSVPNPRAPELPGARRREPPPPPDHLHGSADAAPALARLCA